MPSDEKKTSAPESGGAKGEPQAAKARVNSYTNYVPPRSAKGSSGWVHAPANLKLLMMAERELMAVAVERGMKARHPTDVRYVRAAMVEGETVVHVYPTDARDKDRIEIKRNDAGAWINLITLLGPEGLLVEVGYKESFVITSVGAEATFGPAITFDMAKPVDRKLISGSKKSAASTPANETAAGSEAEG